MAQSTKNTSSLSQAGGVTDRRRFLSLSMAATAVGSVALLSGCGFRLRGWQQQYAFRSIYFSNPSSAVVTVIKRILRGGQLSVVDKASEAEVVLHISRDDMEQAASALNASASVRELELRRFFDFNVNDANGNVLIENAEIHLSRYMSYNESEATARESEIAFIFDDMVNDIARQVLRRLATIEPVQQTKL